MSGSMGEMGSLLKQAQKMQRDLDRARGELAAIEIQGTAGGGVVRVTLTGDRQVQSVDIAEEVLEQDGVPLSERKAMLEEMLVVALRDALKRASETAQERMNKVTGGVQLPGFF